jgi:hypothetical protein
VPSAECGQAVLLDEAFFSAPCRLVVDPIVALVEHASAIADQLLRVFVSAFVQLDRNDTYSRMN